MTESLFPATMQDLIACAEREVVMRQRVYPRRVADKRMSQEAADCEIRLMQSIVDELRAVGAARGYGSKAAGW